VGRFVQGIERQPTPGTSDSWLVLALTIVGARQSLQGAPQLRAKVLALKELPLVESRAIPQGEAGQKVVAIKFYRLSQEGGTVQAHFFYPVAMRAARCQSLLECFHIQPDLRHEAEPHTFPVGLQPTLTQHLLDRRQGTTQTSSRPALVVFRPQQGRQRISAAGPSRNRQIGYKG
jgi:hypothetical protein